MFSSTQEDEEGIIPRVIRQIFETIEKTKEEVEYLIRVAFLEIYNETLKDLLNPAANHKSIHVREDEKKGIIVQGISEETVTSQDDMLRYAWNWWYTKKIVQVFGKGFIVQKRW